MAKLIKIKHSFLLRMFVAMQVFLISIPKSYAIGSLGDVAATMTSMAGDLAQFLQMLSFIIGFGFGVGAIVKYKNHRDNPQHVTLTVPVTLFFVSLAFLFLGVLLLVSGQAIFGPGAQTGASIGTDTIN